MEYIDFPAMNGLEPDEIRAQIVKAELEASNARVKRILETPNPPDIPTSGQTVFIHTGDDLLPFISNHYLFMAILVGIISACGYVLATA